jgi:hypothetical protein
MHMAWPSLPLLHIVVHVPRGFVRGERTTVLTVLWPWLWLLEISRSVPESASRGFIRSLEKILPRLRAVLPSSS